MSTRQKAKPADCAPRDPERAALEHLPAITLHQPWASLIACGAKRYETRSWSTSYRGPRAIHAGKAWTMKQSLLCEEEPWASLLRRAGFAIPEAQRWQLGVVDQCETFGLPLSRIVAVARLVDVLPSAEVVSRIDAQERTFGDFSVGRFAWLYADVVPLRHAIPASGRQGLWRLPDRVACLVAAQAGLQVYGAGESLRVAEEASHA